MAEDRVLACSGWRRKGFEGNPVSQKNRFWRQEGDKLEERFWKWEFLECPMGRPSSTLLREAEAVVGHSQILRLTT